MRALLVALALCSACKKDKHADSDDPTPEMALCHADEVPEEATLRFGWQGDGTFVSYGGKIIDPAGPTLDLLTLPLDVAVHPDGTWAYVTEVDRGSARLAVVDLDQMAEIQSLERDNLHTGMEIDPVALKLYVATGPLEGVDVLDIEADGTLGAGPDRSQEWYAVQDAYLQMKMGRITLEEAEARLRSPRMALDAETWEELAEEVEEETFAYDGALAWYRAWAAAKGLEIP